MSLLLILANIYSSLAQSLALSNVTNSPAWLEKPGREWPLYNMVVDVSSINNAHVWEKARAAIEKVSAAPMAVRRAEYQSLFVGAGRPSIWLYESQHLNGRLPGPATFQVKKLYLKAGLESRNAELPDHAALELEFLAYLSEQASNSNRAANDWYAVQKLFIKNHAGLWLPTVGQQMIGSVYPAWAAIGNVLIASLSKAEANSRVRKKTKVAVYPGIAQEDKCTLCGFCVQACPEQALKIHENEQATELWLIAKNCTHCRKCEVVCGPKALAFRESKISATILLRQSERANCSACNAPTVSQVEINAVAAMLGEHPAWLDTCLNCRSQAVAS